MNATMTITLKSDEVTKAVEEYLKSNGFELKSKIRFNIGNECSGYGMNESSTPRFDGITVDVKPKTI